MILGYSFPEFEELILSGKKIHTIRKLGRWKAGMKIHHSYGIRTKKYRCFLVNKCTGVQKIEFKFKNKYVYPDIYIDDSIFSDISFLVHNDGFIDETIKAKHRFFKFFNKSCVMDIVHWTNFRY